jgi:hypothetical protein
MVSPARFEEWHREDLERELDEEEREHKEGVKKEIASRLIMPPCRNGSHDWETIDGEPSTWSCRGYTRGWCKKCGALATWRPERGRNLSYLREFKQPAEPKRSLRG